MKRLLENEILADVSFVVEDEIIKGINNDTLRNLLCSAPLLRCSSLLQRTNPSYVQEVIISWHFS
jgi:hypothetical protein